jgi:A nuclease of the HNH/ENDO VII superfamily with conserved WHH
MAANINNSPQRFDYARAERDDENNPADPATPEAQTPAQSETTIAAPAEQQGQSSGDGSNAGNDAGTHDPSKPPPAPEETIPLPAHFRYGLGEISMGRPDYTRAYADRAQQSEAEPGPRATALAPKPRTENTPSPAAATTAPAKPIPMPKPAGSIIAGTPASSLPPAVTPAITNAPSISGEVVEEQPPSNRTPYLYAGLNTAPDQSPHYANALAYGREQGYSDDEIMKLAVLMQNNRDANLGREWLTLKPAVLRAAVNAVVYNPVDGSFDTSVVFGGRLGYPQSQLPEPRVNIDENGQGYTLDVDYNRTPAAIPTTPPPGWVLEIIPANPYGDNPSPEQRYFRMSDELFAAKENPYLPLAVAGYMQVPRGYESELSVGADGGVHDLSALDFDPEFGLVTRTDNYRPYTADGNDWDRFMEIVTVGTIVVGTLAVIGPTVAAGFGTSPAGVVATGAVKGVIGSAITTMLQEGEVTFRGLLQAAFSGGMIAGLSTLESYQALDSLGRDATGATHFALRAMSITGTSTIRGAIQELIGGKFEDGFKQGLVQGLAAELTSYLNAEINAGLAHEQITPAQADALRELTRFTGTALRAAANPNDPMYAFAQDYLGQLFGPAEAATVTGSGNKPVDAETQQQIIWMQDAIDLGYTDTAATHFNNILERRAAANPTTPRTDIANQLIRELGIKPDTLGFVVGTNGRVTAGGRTITPTFDEQGNLMPGVLDASKPIGNQARQIEAHLLQQGYSVTDARQIAEGWLVNRIADSIQAAKPATSRQDALNQARAGLNDPNPIVVGVTTRAHVPGQEIGEQFLGALVGTIDVAVDVLKGTVDLLAMSADGYAQIANVLTGGELFPDVTRRNEARSEIFDQLVNNWDKLPGAMVDQFNAQLERANQLDAQDTPASRFEAATIRSHVFGSVALAVLTLGETAVAGGSRVISSLADARAALGEIVSAGPLRGSLAAQSGAVDIAAMLDGGRVLVRVGTEFFVGELREIAGRAGRQLVLLRPVTDLLDDASRLQLRYGPESMAPENLARINRAIDALTPQRFQQLTERYAQLVNSNKPWNWESDFNIALSESQQSAIRRAAVEAGLLPDVPYVAGTAFRDFNAIPGLVRNVEKLPENMWRLSDPEQFAYLDRLIGGRPPGYTWHHSHQAGRMELIPYGIHRVYRHEGGRAPGQWAHRPEGR